jgi:hypothetical protein
MSYFHNWKQIAKDKGFQTEKEMLIVLRKQYKNLSQLQRNEFPSIALTTLKLKIRTLGLAKVVKTINDHAKDRGFNTPEDMIRAMLPNYESFNDLARAIGVKGASVTSMARKYRIKLEGETKSSNSVQNTINNDIYYGHESPCKDCKYKYDDKLNAKSICSQCGKPQYWHDHKYPDAFAAIFVQTHHGNEYQDCEQE